MGPSKCPYSMNTTPSSSNKMTAKQRLEVILNLAFTPGKVFYLQQVYLIALPIFKESNPNNNTLDSLIRYNLEELEKDGKLDYLDTYGNKVVRENGTGSYRLL